MTEADFIRAVVERPGDDTPRLAFADWLEEWAGDLPDPGDARDRAAFIRAQCELARLVRSDETNAEAAGTLRRQVDELLARPRSWFDAGEQVLTVWNGPVPPDEPEIGVVTWEPTEDDAGYGVIEVYPDRGFVGGVRCSTELWSVLADSFLAVHPIRRVSLTTPIFLPSLSIDWANNTYGVWIAGAYVAVQSDAYERCRAERKWGRLFFNARWPQIPVEGWVLVDWALNAPEPTRE